MFFLNIALPPECAETYAPRPYDADFALHDLEALFCVEAVADEPWAALMRRFCLASRLEMELLEPWYRTHNERERMRPIVTARVDAAMRMVCTFDAAMLRRANLLFPLLFHSLQAWPGAVHVDARVMPRFFGVTVEPRELALQQWCSVSDEPCAVYDMLMSIPACSDVAAPFQRPALFRARPIRLGTQASAAAAAVAAARSFSRPAPRANQVALAAWARCVESCHTLAQCFENVAHSRPPPSGSGGIVVCARGAGRRLAIHTLCASDTEAFAAADELTAPLPPWRLMPHLAHCALMELQPPVSALLDCAGRRGSLPGGTLILAQNAVEAVRWHTALQRQCAATHAVLFQNHARARARAAAALDTASFVVATYSTLSAAVHAQDLAHDTQLAGTRWRCPGVPYICTQSASSVNEFGVSIITENCVVTVAAAPYLVTHIAQSGAVFGKRVWGLGAALPSALRTADTETQLAIDGTQLTVCGVVRHCTELHRCLITEPRCHVCGFDCAPVVAELRRRLPATPLLARAWRRVVCDGAQCLASPLSPTSSSSSSGSNYALDCVMRLVSARRWCLVRVEMDAAGRWLPPCSGRPDGFDELAGALDFVTQQKRRPDWRVHTTAWLLEPVIAILPATAATAAAEEPDLSGHTSSAGPVTLPVHFDDADAHAYEAERVALGLVVERFGGTGGHVAARPWLAMTARLQRACAVLPADRLTCKYVESVCPVCHEDVDLVHLVALPCGHGFCAQCLTHMLSNSRLCGYCRRPLTLQDVHAALATCCAPGPALRGAHKLHALEQLVCGDGAAADADADTRTLILTHFPASILRIGAALRARGVHTFALRHARQGAKAAGSAVVVTTPTVAHMCAPLDVAHFTQVVFVDVPLTTLQRELQRAIQRAAASAGVRATQLVTVGTIEETCLGAPLPKTGGFDAAPWLLATP